MGSFLPSFLPFNLSFFLFFLPSNLPLSSYHLSFPSYLIPENNRMSSYFPLFPFLFVMEMFNRELKGRGMGRKGTNAVSRPLLVLIHRRSCAFYGSLSYQHIALSLKLLLMLLSMSLFILSKLCIPSYHYPFLFLSSSILRFLAHNFEFF